MGYFVRKTSFGLRPVTGTSDIEINDTDGYCLSPDEYVNIQQTLSSQKKRIGQLQQEKEQEEQEILDYYKDAFQKVKKECSNKLSGELQRIREKYVQPLTECEKQLAVIKIQLEELQTQLNEAKQYGVDQEILNKNLLRILRERANADRSITPKKHHHGYIILCSQQLNENHKKDGISTWKTQIQTPYPVTLKSYEIQGQIFQDFVDKDIFSEMRIDSADADKDSDYIAKMQDYLFKANSRTGLWEVELYTTGEITIPQNMLQPKKNTAGSCKSFQKDSIKSNVR